VGVAFLAEVPLAELGRGVAGLLQRLRERDGLRRERRDVVDRAQRAGAPVKAVDAADGVDAGAGAVLAAEQRRARRLAVGAAGVAVREPHSLAGQAVDVRRLVVLAAVGGDVGVAEVVGEDQDDVGLAGRSVRSGGAGGEQRGEDAGDGEDVSHRIPSGDGFGCSVTTSNWNCA
jgi:hypothetical protein